MLHQGIKSAANQPQHTTNTVVQHSATPQSTHQVPSRYGYSEVDQKTYLKTFDELFPPSALKAASGTKLAMRPGSTGHKRQAKPTLEQKAKALFKTVNKKIHHLEKSVQKIQSMTHQMAFYNHHTKQSLRSLQCNRAGKGSSFNR